MAAPSTVLAFQCQVTVTPDPSPETGEGNAHSVNRYVAWLRREPSAGPPGRRGRVEWNRRCGVWKGAGPPVSPDLELPEQEQQCYDHAGGDEQREQEHTGEKLVVVPEVHVEHDDQGELDCGEE